MAIREHLFHKRAPADPLFRWRGGDISRLEALADGVFALALALLMVSPGVPETFGDLQRILRDMPAFAFSFWLLVMCWYYHYKFFRRYGLEDFRTVLFNGAMLFLILFYVYPLRFLFLWLWHAWIGVDVAPFYEGAKDLHGLMAQPERGMMLFYSAGIVGIFGLFTWMHVYALKLAPALELDAIEIYLTRSAIVGHLGSAVIGLVSIGLALSGHPGLAGLAYMLMPVFHGVHGKRTRKRADELHAALTG